MTRPTIPDDARAYALGFAAGREDYVRGVRDQSRWDHPGAYGRGYRDRWTGEQECSETRRRENCASFDAERPTTSDRWKG